MTRYAIHTVWRVVGRTDTTESTGLIVEAESPEQARVIATRRGIASGLGTNPTYVGLAAIPLECLP